MPYATISDSEGPLGSVYLGDKVNSTIEAAATSSTVTLSYDYYDCLDSACDNQTSSGQITLNAGDI